jgi:hypothetical protein
MASRLFDALEAGFSASLVWDAYDNYHDHDEAWTIYGLLRTGLRLYTPKKRYHAMKQVFRFVRPGFQRIAADSNQSNVRTNAFTSPDRTQFTLCGIHSGLVPVRMNVELAGLPQPALDRRVVYHRTSEQENCIRVEKILVRGHQANSAGFSVIIPPACIFTLTTEED